MRHRRRGGRRTFSGQIELPDDPSIGSLGRLRNVVAQGRVSALDVIDAEQRVATHRQPGYFRLGVRLSFIGVVVVGLFAVLLVRLWSIQVIHKNNAELSALGTTTRQVETAAPRGLILARGGQELAGDKSELVVTLSTSIDANTTPATRVASPKTEADLATLIPGLSVASIKKQLNNEQYGPYQPVPVAEGISAAAATTIEVNPTEFAGATVTSEYVRDYPESSLAAQIIGNLSPIESDLSKYESEGYLPTDLIGANGLEYQYQSDLRGQPGEQTDLYSAAGSQLKTLSTKPPTPGDSVVLNMDLPLEQDLLSALSSDIGSLRSTGDVPADWGAAVVLGPQGQVLAMGSVPSYNDNDWVGGISDAEYKSLESEEGQPLNDYTLAGDQPPGSTFKIATATAALDDGLITPTSEIDDPGYFNLPGGLTLTDSNGESFGDIDVTTALTVSSDVFFYNLGADFWDDRAKYGESPIQNVAAAYGYGEGSGIDLPGEAPGQVDSPQLTTELHKEYPKAYPATEWYLGDNVEMAFGQGATLVTPLEEADTYATFADGGTRYAPEMAAGIVSPAGKVLRRFQPKVEAHVPLPPSTRDAMLAGFEGAVQNARGTAYYDFTGFNFNTWDLAGKTGTADVAAANEQPTAWFVAFGGPKDDPSARYTVAVEIDQAGYGADAAAPVARQVFDYLYDHGVPALDLSKAAGGD